jgi:hypothetical protein
MEQEGGCSWVLQNDYVKRHDICAELGTLNGCKLPWLTQSNRRPYYCRSRQRRSHRGYTASTTHHLCALANDLQHYACTKFDDAEKETAKLKQQIEEKASPEAIALTANYTAAMLSSANVALQGAMKAYEKADKAKPTATMRNAGVPPPHAFRQSDR